MPIFPASGSSASASPALASSASASPMPISPDSGSLASASPALASSASASPVPISPTSATSATAFPALASSASASPMPISPTSATSASAFPAFISPSDLGDVHWNYGLPPEVLRKDTIADQSVIQFSPVTPDKSKTIIAGEHSDAANKDVVDTQEESQKALVEEIPGVDQQSSSTPNQKPKRRKVRPKVITQGKKQRQKKAAMPPKAVTTPEIPRVKRKYTRKHKNLAGTSTGTEAEHDNVQQSARRSLNFDVEEATKEESSSKNAADAVTKVDALNKLATSPQKNLLSTTKTSTARGLRENMKTLARKKNELGRQIISGTSEAQGISPSTSEILNMSKRKWNDIGCDDEKNRRFDLYDGSSTELLPHGIIMYDGSYSPSLPVIQEQWEGKRAKIKQSEYEPNPSSSSEVPSCEDDEKTLSCMTAAETVPRDIDFNSLPSTQVSYFRLMAQANAICYSTELPSSLPEHRNRASDRTRAVIEATPSGVARKRAAAADMPSGVVQNENALIVYDGSGTMVPYDSLSNLPKRRKPRPRVQLDEETNRVWLLLMGTASADAPQGTDAEKERWWEEERRVWQGRAESFIARMHLVQGDRRFSPWKGSVVDSVVGVFLTQNASDHLSSSAFMKLAARFPIQRNMDCVKIPTENGDIYLVDLDSRRVKEQERLTKEDSACTKSLDNAAVDQQNSIASSQNSGGACLQSQIINSLHLPDGKMCPDFSTCSFMELLEAASNTFNFFPEETTTTASASYELDVASQCEMPQAMVHDPIASDGMESLCIGKEQVKKKTTTSTIATESDPTKVGNIKEEAGVVGKRKRKRVEKKPVEPVDWDLLRKQQQQQQQGQGSSNGIKKQRSRETMDSVDWEAVRRADVSELSDCIRERGMNNRLAERIKGFLDRLVEDHGSIDLEWLRSVPPDKVKDYLLSIKGLGLKSVECVRLLTLQNIAFPVDTNVGRICVRLGWVPLEPLPESLQLHLLELYPILDTIQKYLWPRLCKLDHRTLYELHYQMITFGKVFCTKSKPNCNACPMRGECKHFASAFASARLALPAPEEKGDGPQPTKNQQLQSNVRLISQPPSEDVKVMALSQQELSNNTEEYVQNNSQPIIEEPTTPEPESLEAPELEIEDLFCEDPDEIPTIKLNIEKFTENLQSIMQESNVELQEADISKALVALTPEAASLPQPRLKNISRLRTEHRVYELPDSHPLLEGLEPRETDDPSPYLLAIWSPGETAESLDSPQPSCSSQMTGILCAEGTCSVCSCIREERAQIVRGTLLIPCRSAMRGSFPLNGTYFQVNELFADHSSSLNPIDIPRQWIWNLPRRTVYFGTSVTTIFKGLTTEAIQECFCRGFVCVRGFDRPNTYTSPFNGTSAPSSKQGEEQERQCKGETRPMIEFGGNSKNAGCCVTNYIGEMNAMKSSIQEKRKIIGDEIIDWLLTLVQKFTRKIPLIVNIRRFENIVVAHNFL